MPITPNNQGTQIGETITFLGCDGVKVTGLHKNTSEYNPLFNTGGAKIYQPFRLVKITESELSKCKEKMRGAKGEFVGWWANLGRGNMTTAEKSLIASGKKGCSDGGKWQKEFTTAIKALSDLCVSQGGLPVNRPSGTGCEDSWWLTDRVCRRGKNPPVAVPWNTLIPGGGKPGTYLEFCKQNCAVSGMSCNSIHSVGRAGDMFDSMGGRLSQYYWPDPYHIPTLNHPAWKSWFCWVKHAHNYKINSISNEFWHWQYHGHEGRTAGGSSNVIVNTDSTGVSGGGGNVVTTPPPLPDGSGDLSIPDFDYSSTNSDGSVNFDVPNMDSYLDEDVSSDSYNSLETVERTLALERFQPTSNFQGVFFLEDDVSNLSLERFDNAQNVSRMGNIPIIDGNRAYMTSIDDIWKDMPIESDPKVLAAQSDIDKLRVKLSKLKQDSDDKKKIIQELTIIVNKISPEDDVQFGGLEEDKLVVAISKLRESGSPIADNLQYLLDDIRNSRLTKEEQEARAKQKEENAKRAEEAAKQNQDTTTQQNTDQTSTTTASTTTTPTDVAPTTDFVPTPATGAEPQQRTGKILGPVVKFGETKGSLWYQEFTMFAVAYAGVANLKPTVQKIQGTERVANYHKTPGDDKAYVEMGTSGLGGIQYTFPRQDWGPRWINFSYFEEPARGWASGQPTGPFIVNGKNYGAKTASRRYLPVLYWLKGEIHPRLETRGERIFKAKKVNPPHAQNPESQAAFIENITIAAPGAKLLVNGDKRVGGAEGAFIGKTTDASGNIAYFAGLKTSDPSNDMLTEMHKKGKKIEWMISADPGGSFHFQSDGQKHPANTKAGIPVALKW